MHCASTDSTPMLIQITIILGGVETDSMSTIDTAPMSERVFEPPFDNLPSSSWYCYPIGSYPHRNSHHEILAIRS